ERGGAAAVWAAMWGDRAARPMAGTDRPSVRPPSALPDTPCDPAALRAPGPRVCLVPGEWLRGPRCVESPGPRHRKKRRGCPAGGGHGVVRAENSPDALLVLALSGIDSSLCTLTESATKAAEGSPQGGERTRGRRADQPEPGRDQRRRQPRRDRGTPRPHPRPPAARA